MVRHKTCANAYIMTCTQAIQLYISWFYFKKKKTIWSTLLFKMQIMIIELNREKQFITNFIETRDSIINFAKFIRNFIS